MKPLSLLAILISVFTLSFCITGTILEEQEPNIPLETSGIHLTLIALDSNNPIEATIRHYASEYGVDVNTALRIATCESQMGKYKNNWSGSSAKGVYMFIDRTWKYSCEGDVLNDEDNVKCFMELYNKYPSYWECK